MEETDSSSSSSEDSLPLAQYFQPIEEEHLCLELSDQEQSEQQIEKVVKPIAHKEEDLREVENVSKAGNLDIPIDGKRIVNQLLHHFPRAKVKTIVEMREILEILDERSRRERHWDKHKAVTRKELAAQKRHALGSGGGPPERSRWMKKSLLIQPGLDDEVESLDSDYHRAQRNNHPSALSTFQKFPIQLKKLVDDPSSEPPSAAVELVESQDSPVSQVVVSTTPRPRGFVERRCASNSSRVAEEVRVWLQRARRSIDHQKDLESLKMEHHKRLFQLKEEKELEFQGLRIANEKERRKMEIVERQELHKIALQHQQALNALQIEKKLS
uniref:Uncharacterized protein n=1 Tax=Timema cristinae TaxID=61476 RepID=A0A7R9D6D2_TIMCR|nr:unnamed protein product [Timema cristinae]